MPKEIERKFLVNTTLMPDLSGIDGIEIDQGYLAVGEESEARIRSKNGADYSLTVKTTGEMVRGEFEIEIAKDQYMVLWPATEGRRVEKTRYPIPTSGRLVELDVYKAALHGLVIAEVEFPNEDAANDFSTPDYFGIEVTADKRYKNQQLALTGRAPERL